MPGWSEINEDIQRNGNGNFAEYALQLCQKYLLDIHSCKDKGRNKEIVRGTDITATD